VHLLCNWGELASTAQSWARIALYVVSFWLLLNHPTLAMMMMFGYRAMNAQ